MSESAARFLFNRLRIRATGLRFKVRSESEVPRDLLNKLDVLYPAQTVLGTFDYVRGACFASIALPLALKAGEPRRLVTSLASEAIYTAMLDGVGGARRTGEIRDGINILCVSMENPYVHGVSRLTASLCAYWSGDWNKVIGPAARADQIFSRQVAGGTWEAALARSVWHTVAIHAGTLRELESAVPRGLIDARTRSDGYAELDLMRNLIAIHLAGDRCGDATAELDRMYTMLRRFPTTSITHLLASAGVATALYGNRLNEATRHLSECWNECRKVGLHHFPLVRLTHLGMTADCVRADASLRPEVRARELLQLARRAAAVPVAWARALRRAIEGVARALENEPSLAFNAFDEANELYLACGMPLDAACARYEQSAFAPALTAQELRDGALEFFASQGIKNPSRFSAIVHSLY